ncbi:glutamine synthetase family protein [Nocardioides sp. Bht2]|uniref:glutamine synthetase family protein n=1 Tax=Nocardioides sp. Bht2 TaxID=3392297 RepID=UPI0039B54F0C
MKETTAPNLEDLATGRVGFIADHGLWTEAQQRKADQVLAAIDEHDLEMVRVVYVDPHGLTRSKSLTPSAFRATMRNGIDTSPGGVIFDTGLDLVFNPFEEGGGLGNEGMTGAADFLLVPDPDTFQILPWCEATGWILADEYLKSAKPLPYSSRLLLKQALAKLADRGLQMVVGLEVEWYLTHLVDQKYQVDSIGGFGRPGDPPVVTPLNLGYQFMSENLCDEAEEHIRDLRRAITGFGMPLRTTEHESGPGQMEFTFAPLDALAAADAMVLFRTAAKQISARQGLHATFMCAPKLDGFDASGWHLHQSLFDVATATNAFMSTDEESPLSELARHYAGGLLAHAPATTIFGAPTVNGYKRLSERFSLSPDRATWSADNRGTYLRVLAEAGDPASHYENRVGEPAANPYLYIASQLVAGLNGIDESLDPGPMTVDPHDDSLPRLPGSLSDAADELDQSALFRKEFGDEFVDYFLRLKRNEWRRYTESLAADGIDEDQDVVTDWEQREYFRMY